MGALPAIPAALLPALPLDGSEMIRIRQGSGWVYATVAQIAALTTAAAGLAAANALIVGLTQRVAALEGVPDPCVALSGALPVATLQIGTVTVAVPVAGLRATDRVSVQPAADLPPGLVLAWAHPAADGTLTVALDALAVLALKSPIPLLVTALR